MESIKGDLTLADDNGSAGPATISVDPYGYQTIGFDRFVEPSWFWVVEMYGSDGVLEGVVATDSPNATARARIQPPDNTAQYGNHIWWRQLIPTADVNAGDTWIVYGWKPTGNGFPVAYPPMREYRP